MTSDEELGEDLVELERASRVLEAERSRRLVEVERGGLERGRAPVGGVVARGAPARGVRSSLPAREALTRAPADAAASEALGEGELSSEAVRLLVGAREAAPESFDQAEPMLVEAAVALPARELRCAIAYWRQAADAAGAEERARRIYEGRHLHVSSTIEGTVRIDGSLDPESGQTASVPTWSSRWTWPRCRVVWGSARSSPTPVRSRRRPPGAWRAMRPSQGR